MFFEINLKTNIDIRVEQNLQENFTFLQKFKKISALICFLNIALALCIFDFKNLSRGSKYLSISRFNQIPER